MKLQTKKKRKNRIWIRTAGILLACMMLLSMAGTVQADEALDDIIQENLYAMRIQYAQDVAMMDIYNLRMGYYSSVEEQSSIRYRIVDYALSFVGVTPYVHGGGSLWYGTDCSGFVHLIYGDFGYWLPTGSDAYQYGVGSHVSWDEMLPGDIIVYDWGAHVGIYAGNGLVVHCSSPENGTVVWSAGYRNITALVRVLE